MSQVDKILNTLPDTQPLTVIAMMGTNHMKDSNEENERMMDCLLNCEAHADTTLLVVGVQISTQLDQKYQKCLREYNELLSRKFQSYYISTPRHFNINLWDGIHLTHNSMAEFWAHIVYRVTYNFPKNV